MFGYIGTIESELKVREAASYKSWYCGLCKCMKRHYGPFSPLFLRWTPSGATVCTDVTTPTESTGWRPRPSDSPRR